MSVFTSSGSTAKTEILESLLNTTAKDRRIPLHWPEGEGFAGKRASNTLTRRLPHGSRDEGARSGEAGSHASLLEESRDRIEKAAVKRAARERQPETVTDGEIIRRVCSGETRLFDELVRRHQDQVYGMAARPAARAQDNLPR
jgi:hypothetical protein